MGAKLSVLARKTADGTVESSFTVSLTVTSPTALAGSYNFTNNGDGTYTIDIDSDVGGSCIGTIYINGIAQTEFTDRFFPGEESLDHLLLESYGGSGVASSVHGLISGDGAFVGTTKVQTLTNKTITDATNNISATRLTSGTLPVDRIAAGSLVDSKLATITTANKVSGSAIQLSATPGLEDSTGLQVKDGNGIEVGAGGVAVKLDTVSGSGLTVGANGLAANPLSTGGIEIASDKLQIDVSEAVKRLGLYNSESTDDDPPWGNPKNFLSTDTFLAAVLKIDTRLWDLYNATQDTSDKHALAIFTQNNVSLGTVATAWNNDGSYFYTTTMSDQLKGQVAFHKSDAISSLSARGQVASANASETATLTLKIKDTADSVLASYSKAVVGTSFEDFLVNFTLNDTADGFYIFEWYLKSSSASHKAYLRLFQAMVSNYTWSTFELNSSTFWQNLAESEEV